MRRWHEEAHIMRRRLKMEKWVHESSGTSYEDCHCYEKPGLFRKHRPLDLGIVVWRKLEQIEQKLSNKRIRRMPIEVEIEA